MNTQKRIRIEHDQDAESPREWDNRGTMVCWHGRYKLGDEQPTVAPEEFFLQLAEEFEPGIEERIERFASQHLDNTHPATGSEWHKHHRTVMAYQQEQVEKVLNRHIIMLPLHLYDHGGITMRTTGFHCPWDSGQVGFIYVSRAKVRQEFGWKRITKAREQQINDYLKGEVETYDQYLRGEVYGFIVEQRPEVYDEDGDLVDVGDDELWAHVDSCYGFYGDDPHTNGMAEHIDKELHHLLPA